MDTLVAAVPGVKASAGVSVFCNLVAHVTGKNIISTRRPTMSANGEDNLG